MNILKYSLISLLVLVLIGSAGYLLASSGIESKPGYVKLTTPSWFVTDTKLALNLGPKGLKPVRWLVNRVVNASGDELEPEERLLLTVLHDLQGVQLRIYEVENNRPVFEQAIDDSVDSLRQAQWQTILQVREDDKRIVVMQSEHAGLITGLSVLASTPENAVFINLLGHINPDSIAMIAKSLN